MDSIRENNNVFGDNIAYIKEYDFSTANCSHQDRLNTVTLISSVCYNKPDVIGSQKLYDRLAMEGAGIPSSSFSFVPVLLDSTKMEQLLSIMEHYNLLVPKMPDVLTFGEVVEGTLDNNPVVLTNLRALLQDLGWTVNYKMAQTLSEEFFNTSEEELAKIKKYFKVYKVNIDMATSKQYIRHNFIGKQELSRRYVSANKLPFSFYISEKMQGVTSKQGIKEYLGVTNYVPATLEDIYEATITYTTQDVIDTCLKHYNAALAQGVQPQEARRIIPQCAYTTIWTGITPRVLDNLLKLRTAPSTQWEFRQLANQIASWENWTDTSKEAPNE